MKYYFLNLVFGIVEIRYNSRKLHFSLKKKTYVLATGKNIYNGSHLLNLSTSQKLEINNVAYVFYVNLYFSEIKKNCLEVVCH